MSTSSVSGYEYILRPGSPYLEISSDATSNVFHVTQIMTAACMYTFPPYNNAGLDDLASYLTDGKRSTHMSEDGSIVGFGFNVATPMYEKQESLQKAWPEIYEYGRGIIEKNPDFRTEAKTIDFIKKAEEKFGKMVTVKSKGKFDGTPSNITPIQSP